MKKTFNIVVIILFVLFFLTLISPALLGKLSGVFKPHEIPKEYVELNSFLSQQPRFYRTLWLPSWQRYGYYSTQHPALSAQDFFSVADPIAAVRYLHQPNVEKQIQEAGVRYIVIPYDSEGEIYLRDRKYDNMLYLTVIKNVQSIPWLHAVASFGEIKVFEVENYKEHFWSNTQKKISYTFIDPTDYVVHVRNMHVGDKLIFAEGYDPNWQVSLGGKVINSAVFDSRYNSFILPVGGTYDIHVFYSPQKEVYTGFIISCISFMLLAVSSLIIWFRQKRMLK